MMLRPALVALALLTACGAEDPGQIPADDALAPDAAGAEQPDPNGPSVQVGKSGKLLYRKDARGNRVPDFSNAGYGGGGVALPSAPVRATVRPIAGDAGPTIQAAIDQVSRLSPGADGVRGAVLLKKGTYRIAGSLRLRHSGVVLRGEGQGADGTVLVAAGTGQRTLIDAGGQGDRREVPGTRRALIDDYVPVGARSFRVASAAGLQVGDTIIVERPSTAAWIHALGMDRIPPRPDGGKVTQWTAGSKDLLFDRVITAVRGDVVTVDAPLTNATEKQYGGGAIYRYQFPGRAQKIGVESLRGDSDYRSPTDEDHGWVFIALDNVIDGWVRDVTAVHFGLSAVMTGDGAKRVTVQDCHSLAPISQITGGRRYSFNLNGGQLVLWQRNHAAQGRHDFVSGATVPGPNVFLDSAAEQAHSEAGPHQRWAVGTLYDNIHTSGPDAALGVYNRGNDGTGHGWAGANHVLWNSSSAVMRCDSPPTATNWCIGCRAAQRSGSCRWESFNQAVTPRSLYLAQLAERLGPRAVDNLQ